MNNTQATPIETAYRNLQTQLLEYRGTLVPARIDLYVAGFPAAAGLKTLAEYLAKHDDTDACKLSMLGTLTAIVSTRDWSRLPEVDAEEKPKEANGEAHPDLDPISTEDEPGLIRLAEIRAIARQEARAELADVLEKVAKVLREQL